ncbi:hypothetical protein [Microbacterium sp. P02]|uniref:hypothetical protein n=1 Tax=Microbacterium sp. P02 TaxID=3366260 RepID=UPI003671BAFE
MQTPRTLSVLDRPITIEAAVSVVLCVILGARINAVPFAPVAGLVGIALLPALIPTIRRFRTIPTLLILLAVSLGAGVALTSFSSATHDTSMSLAISHSAMVVALIGGIAVLLFARAHIGTPWTAISYGAGMVGGIFLEPVSGSNAWRFTYSLPIAVLVLAILSMRPRLAPQLLALVGLGVIGLVNDSRSNSAMLFLAAAILLWQRFSRAVSKGRRRAGNIIGLILVAAGFFQLAQFSLLEGYFGEVSQDKTAAQIATSGSLLLGGRPEASASFAIIREYPLGLGSGTLPTGGDVTAAKTAMQQIGYDPNNGYVERFMFGSGIEVHSMLGDFWIWFGLAGLAACVVMVTTVVWGLEHRLRSAGLTALLAYLSVRFFWDLLFSPASSSMKFVTLTIALAAIAITETTPAGLRARDQLQQGADATVGVHSYPSMRR